MVALSTFRETDMADQELDFIRDELVKAMRLAEQGKHRQSVDVCARSLRNAAQKAMPLPEGFVGALLTRMGLSLAAQSDWDDALFHYRLAEGVLLRRKESIRQVRSRYHIALYSTDDDLRLLLADIYQALGQLYDARDEGERASAHYKQAFKIAQSMDNIGLSWRSLATLASSLQGRGEWNDLLGVAERMLRLNQRDPQPSREIMARRYMAQAFGRTGCMDDMLAELERIVAISRETGHPDLHNDERALARAQQAILGLESEASKPLSIITIEPEQVRLTTSGEVHVLPRPSGAAAARTNPTPLEATQCPADLIHGIHIEAQSEGGAREAVFVLQTRHMEQAMSLFQYFRPALLPISIPGMRQLGDRGVNLPNGGQILLEWSLPDLLPNVLLHSDVVSDSLHDALEYTNRDNRRLSVFLEGREGRFGRRKRMPLTGLFDPYVLDWRGITGVVRFLRRSYLAANGVLSDQEAFHLITLLQMPLKDGLQATGIYREMGFIYRLIRDLDSAVGSFQEEIAFSLNKDGMPSSHVAQAFRQLGLIHMERGDRTKAHDALMAGLAVNPNSYDTLTAIAGITDDATEALRFLGRAYRIRTQDDSWLGVVEEAAMHFDRTTEQIEQAAAIVATQVDLSTRFEMDRTALARLGIL